MRSTFTRIIIMSSGLYAIACGLFLYMLWRLEANHTILAAALLFTVAGAIVMAGFMLAIRREMSSILFKLSRTIQSLIDAEEEPKLFFAVRDDMLSKLQEQIVKLSRNLKMQKKIYKQESDEVKSLISDIAHQLKTPHANLNMYLGLLMDPELDAGKREQFTGILAKQVEKLSWLMESLIKMSRLESGVIVIQKAKESIDNTVLSAIKQVFPLAEAKGVDMSFSSSERIELLHDARWTGEAIGNVLDNAVKYTEAGGRVRVTVLKYELFVRIDIEDSGIGIFESEMSDIFKRFYRGAGTANTEGAGIGLYLTRKIIMEQGGYMKVSSERGEGSLFSIYLPMNS